MTTGQENEEIARRIFEEVWQNRNYDVIDELVAEDYVLHDPGVPEGVEWPGGREGYRRMAEMGAEIIDGDLEIQELVPSGDLVVVRWRQTGTHVGKMGSVTGIEIDRFEDGKLVETWQEVNMLPMLMQIGAVPADLFGENMAADA